MKSAVKFVLRSAAAIILAAALAGPAAAQRRGGGRADPLRGGLDRDLERELTLGELEKPRPSTRRDPRPSYAQVSADFTRIQVINNELIRAASLDGALDFRFVAESASEIRKLAARLKSNLALPESEEDFESPKSEALASDAQLRAGVSELGKLIAGFAHNPVFKKPGVVDAQMWAKAGRDMEEIIMLSEQVKKAGEKLSRAARRSQ